MARTVNTVPYDHRTGNCDNHNCGVRASLPAEYGWYARYACNYIGPQHVLRDLRFSALDEVKADREGRRTIPQPVRVAIPRHLAYGRGFNESIIGAYARPEERKARARTRESLHRARRLANTANAIGDEDSLDWFDLLDDDSVDVPVTRHRHSARWLAW